MQIGVNRDLHDRGEVSVCIGNDVIGMSLGPREDHLPLQIDDPFSSSTPVPGSLHVFVDPVDRLSIRANPDPQRRACWLLDPGATLNEDNFDGVRRFIKLVIKFAGFKQ